MANSGCTGWLHIPKDPTSVYYYLHVPNQDVKADNDCHGEILSETVTVVSIIVLRAKQGALGGWFSQIIFFVLPLTVHLRTLVARISCHGSPWSRWGHWWQAFNLRPQRLNLLVKPLILGLESLLIVFDLLQLSLSGFSKCGLVGDDILQGCQWADRPRG